MSKHRYESYSHEGATVVALHGEFDIATNESLHARIMRAAAQSRHVIVIVDLTHVAFMDASVVGTLMRCYRQLARRKQSLVLAEPSPMAAKVLGALRMNEVFDIYPIVEAAWAGTQHSSRDSFEGTGPQRPFR